MARNESEQVGMQARFPSRLICLGAGLLVFFIRIQEATAHGISDADKQAMLDGGYLRYVGLGASHMVTGYDHLLFLFGVMFFLVTTKDIVKFVTAFTLGHSITLIFATFAGISVNYFLIDAVIALSVCYKGFDNNDGFKNYFGMKSPNLLGMVFIFGLIHGFGLSTRLQQLPLGDDRVETLGRIVSFNVGVELGQVAALLVMVAILSAWRKRPSFERLGRIANDGIILAGVSLFLMQMHGYAHSDNHNGVAALEDGTQQAVPVRKDSSESLSQAPWKDSIEVTIPADSGKEYKLEVAKGAMFEYQWKTDGTELFYDFHGEPAGDTSGYFKSFEKRTDSQASGSLTTSFAGTHGWYWKNATQAPVVVTLRTRGEYRRLDLAKNKEAAGPGQLLPQTHETID